MSKPNLPDNVEKITPLAFFEESVATWTEFGQRTTSLLKQQATRLAMKAEPNAEIAETLTAEMLRTMSDFNLRHWQNMARLLDTMPAWMNSPTRINSGSITDWFDRFQVRDSGKAVSGVAPTVASKSVAKANQPSFLDAPEGEADDLTKIKGIGPKLSRQLNDLGVYHFKQIADWNGEQAAWVDDYLAFRGRVSREDWIGQARKMAANGSGALH